MDKYKNTQNLKTIGFIPTTKNPLHQCSSPIYFRNNALKERLLGFSNINKLEEISIINWNRNEVSM